MLNRNQNLQRYKVLCISSNFSRTQSRLHDYRVGGETRFHNVPDQEHPEEARHSLIIFERDPIIHEDSAEMVEFVSRAMKEAAQEATVDREFLYNNLH